MNKKDKELYGESKRLALFLSSAACYHEENPSVIISAFANMLMRAGNELEMTLEEFEDLLAQMLEGFTKLKATQAQSDPKK